MASDGKGVSIEDWEEPSGASPPHSTRLRENLNRTLSTFSSLKRDREGESEWVCMRACVCVRACLMVPPLMISNLENTRKKIKVDQRLRKKFNMDHRQTSAFRKTKSFLVPRNRRKRKMYISVQLAERNQPATWKTKCYWEGFDKKWLGGQTWKWWRRNEGSCWYSDATPWRPLRHNGC